MWNKLIITTFVSLATITQIEAQNNPIFYGGSGDGSNAGIANQIGNDFINYGGSGDGSSLISFIQSGDDLIFNGGSGDGHSSQVYIQDANNTTNFGGPGDGNAAAIYIQANDAPIYLGSSGDGVSMSGVVQESPDGRFFGGIGDGWVAQKVILPLAPLPLRLLSFEGTAVDQTHVLSWQTAAEINTSHFVIEHATNAVNKYLELGMVTAKGGNSEYTFTNKKPIVGDNFYRLKIKDKDGTFTYSNTVLLKLFLDQSSLQVYPNPTATQINIDVQSKKQQLANIQVFNSSGKIMHQSTTNNGTTATIDVAQWAAGFYIVRVQQGNEVSQIKVVKE